MRYPLYTECMRAIVSIKYSNNTLPLLLTPPITCHVSSGTHPHTHTCVRAPLVRSVPPCYSTYMCYMYIYMYYSILNYIELYRGTQPIGGDTYCYVTISPRSLP